MNFPFSCRYKDDHCRFVAVIVNASTTISTNISTEGNLAVTSTTATSTISTGGFTVGTSQFVVQQNSGNVGIGTTTPTTQLQVTTGTTNATSTLTVGKTGQNKGSCLELFDSAGTAVYAYVKPGDTTFTLSSVSCK